MCGHPSLMSEAFMRIGLARVAPLAFVLALAACGSDNDVVPRASNTTAITTSTSSSNAASSSVTSAGATGSTTTIDVSAAIEALKGGDFTTFLAALRLSGLADRLQGRAVTILVPTNEAFAKLAADQLADVLTDPSKVGDVMNAHVLEGSYTSAQLSKLTQVRTLAGTTLPVRTDGSAVYVGGARITDPDKTSGEMIVHVVDKVLLDEAS